MKKLRFNLIELLVVIGLMMVLVSLLQPSLVKIVDNAMAMECLNTHRLIQTSMTYYMDDNGHDLVTLALRGSPGPDAFVRSYNITWWPDLLRPYLDGLKSVNCASVERIGIGLNHPEIGAWLRKGLNIAEVKSPSRTLMFADSARIENVDEPDPDLWMARQPEQPSIFFRVPSNMPWFNTLPNRVYARHAGKTNALFVDGHAEYLYSSDLGLQYAKGHPNAHWDN